MVRLMIIVAEVLLLTEMAACTPRLVWPFSVSNPVGVAVQETDLYAHTDRISELLRATPAEFPARGQLPIARLCFAQPWQLPEHANYVATKAAAPGAPFQRIARYAATALGTSAPSAEGQGSLKIEDTQMAIFALDFLLNEPNLRLQAALAQCDATAIAPDRVVAALDAALGSTSRNSAKSETLAATIAAATKLDRATLAGIAANFDVEFTVTADWATFEAEELRDDLRGAVEGKVLSMQKVDEIGWVVIGSLEDNTYDMTRVAAVFDPGGNDRYTWSGNVAGSRVVLDLSGNDTYASTGIGGPGGALLGVSAVIDLKGDDRYSGNTLALGAAAFGVGMIVDRAGNDTYTSERWSLGSAFAGVGAVADLEGIDLYDSPLFSQGVGGPCGAGLLLDAAGDDRYRADRTQRSAYDTPATFLAFSQGCSFGYRVGAAGGIGSLVDLAGNDRYECGEFGQGCGYYLGLGILHDAAGDDFYVGNRYAQGTAAHQAFGALEDGSGNDIYHGVTAADQGAAWDMSAAVLLDRSGDDIYISAGTLSQGAAAQQAIGMLIDLAGNDLYRSGAASQGEADGNQYHWEATLCPSFALLWDAAGRNTFSSGRVDGQCVRTGSNESPAGDSGRTQWGLFLAR